MDEISMYLPGIALAYSAFLLGIASPGPNVLAVIGTSMGDGRRSGTALALGIAAGSFCWALLTASGLSALLSSYASALTMIKITGGLYLLWLAYKALQSATAAQDIVPTSLAVSGRGALRYVIRGFTIQMTNPKAALAWIAIISLGFTKTHRPGSDSPLSGVPPFSRPSFTAFMQSRFRRPQWCASTSGQGMDPGGTRRLFCRRRWPAPHQPIRSLKRSVAAKGPGHVASPICRKQLLHWEPPKVGSGSCVTSNAGPNGDAQLYRPFPPRLTLKKMERKRRWGELAAVGDFVGIGDTDSKL